MSGKIDSFFVKVGGQNAKAEAKKDAPSKAQPQKAPAAVKAKENAPPADTDVIDLASPAPQAASNKRKRSLDADAEAKLQTVFHDIAQPNASLIAATAKAIGIDAAEVERWCAARKVRAVGANELIDLTGTPSAAPVSKGDEDKEQVAVGLGASQRMEAAGVNADVVEHVSNTPMEGVESVPESQNEDTKQQGSLGMPQSSKPDGVHASTSGTADGQPGQTSSSSQQQANAGAAAAAAAALNDRPKLLSELQGQIEDVKEALGQEMLLPSSISAHVDRSDSERPRLDALAPEELAAFVEGRRCTLSQLVTQLQGVVPLDQADPNTLRSRVVDLAARKAYAPKDGLAEGLAAADDVDAAAYWFWELRDPKKALAPTEAKGPEAGKGGDKGAAKIAAAACTGNKKLVDLYRKRRKDLGERLSSATALIDLLSKAIAAEAGGKPVGKTHTAKEAKVHSKLSKLPDLGQIEDALDTGHRAVGEKDAARLAQMAAREKERKERGEARRSAKEAAAKEKEAEKGQKEAEKVAKQAAKAAKAVGFNDAKQLSKSAAVMKSFFSKAAPTKTPSKPAASHAPDLGLTPLASAHLTSPALGTTPLAASASPMPAAIAVGVAAGNATPLGASGAAAAAAAHARRLAQEAEALDSEYKAGMSSEQMPGWMQKLRGRWRRARADVEPPLRGAPAIWQRKPGLDIATIHERCVAVFGDSYNPKTFPVARKKLLQFSENQRPAYYGSWSLSSTHVRARRPLGRDPSLNYEVDSDDEWEEEPEGESLSDDDGDDSSELRVGGGEEGDEEEDSFVVENGYLSGDEGVRLDEDGDVDMGGATSAPAPAGPAARDPSLAALEGGVARALRFNRALILCRPGSGIQWEPTSNLDPALLKCLHMSVLRAKPVTVPTECDVYTVPRPPAGEDPAAGREGDASAVPASAVTPSARGTSGAAAEGGIKGRGRTATVFPDALVPTLLEFLKTCTEKGIDKVVDAFIASQLAANPTSTALPKRAVKDKIKAVASYQATRGWVPLPPGAVPAGVAATATPMAAPRANAVTATPKTAVTPLDLSMSQLPATAAAPPTTGAKPPGSMTIAQLVAAAGHIVNAVNAAVNAAGGGGHAGAPTPAPTPALTSLIALQCPSVTQAHAQHAHAPPSASALGTIPHMQPLSTVKGDARVRTGSGAQHPPCTPIPIALEFAPQGPSSSMAVCPGPPANTPAPRTAGPAHGPPGTTTAAANGDAPVFATPLARALQGMAASQPHSTPATTPGPLTIAPHQQQGAPVTGAAAAAGAAAATPTPSIRPITSFFRPTPGGTQPRAAPPATNAELSPAPPAAGNSRHTLQKQQEQQEGVGEAAGCAAIGGMQASAGGEEQGGAGGMDVDNEAAGAECVCRSVEAAAAQLQGVGEGADGSRVKTAQPQAVDDLGVGQEAAGRAYAVHDATDVTDEHAVAASRDIGGPGATSQVEAEQPQTAAVGPSTTTDAAHVNHTAVLVPVPQLPVLSELQAGGMQHPFWNELLAWIVQCTHPSHEECEAALKVFEDGVLQSVVGGMPADIIAALAKVISGPLSAAPVLYAAAARCLSNAAQALTMCAAAAQEHTPLTYGGRSDPTQTAAARPAGRQGGSDKEEKEEEEDSGSVCSASAAALIAAPGLVPGLFRGISKLRALLKAQDTEGHHGDQQQDGIEAEGNGEVIGMALAERLATCCMRLLAVLVRTGVEDGAQPSSTTYARAATVPAAAPCTSRAAAAAVKAAVGLRREVADNKSWRVLLRWCFGCLNATLAGFALIATRHLFASEASKLLITSATLANLWATSLCGAAVKEGAMPGVRKNVLLTLNVLVALPAFAKHALPPPPKHTASGATWAGVNPAAKIPEVLLQLANTLLEDLEHTDKAAGGSTSRKQSEAVRGEVLRLLKFLAPCLVGDTPAAGGGVTPVRRSEALASVAERLWKLMEVQGEAALSSELQRMATAGKAP